MPQNNSQDKTLGVGPAAVGGGGIGTVIVGLAQLMPETESARGFLISVAPALSVAVSSVWIWGVNRARTKGNQTLRDKTVAQLRGELNTVINDPDTPDERKEQAKNQLLTLEDKNFQDRIRILETTIS